MLAFKNLTVAGKMLMAGGAVTGVLLLCAAFAVSHNTRTVARGLSHDYAQALSDGAVANVALSRSLAIAEQTGAQALAGLLDGLIDQVVPPTAWEQVRDQALSLTRPEVRQAIQPATTPRWENVPPPTSGPAPVRPHRTQPPAAGIGI